MPVDFLTNDYFRVLNMTFIYVIMIICYVLELINQTVTWNLIFWKNRGWWWIIVDRFFNIFKKFILLLSWYTKRNDKMSDLMGLAKLDLSMLVFVSWYDTPKIPLLPIFFFGNVLILSKNDSIKASA